MLKRFKKHKLGIVSAIILAFMIIVTLFAEFFAPYGLTDVQFNLMMMLRHHGGTEGLSQARLSEMMMVNRLKEMLIIRFTAGSRYLRCMHHQNS